MNVFLFWFATFFNVHPTQVTLSTDTAMFRRPSGRLGLRSFIRLFAKRPGTTFLIADRAHLECIALKFPGDRRAAEAHCSAMANTFRAEFEDDMKGTEVIACDELLCKAGMTRTEALNFPLSEQEEMTVETETSRCYTPKRMKEYPDEQAFYEKRRLDFRLHYALMHAAVCLYKGNDWAVRLAYPGRFGFLGKGIVPLSVRLNDLTPADSPLQCRL